MIASFDPFPVLTTERLVMRKIMPAYVNEVFFLRSDEEVLHYISNVPAKTTEEAEMWIHKISNLEKNNACINWALTLKEEDKLIGYICFWNFEPEKDKAEIGYAMHPAHYGKGLMQEAMRAMLDYGFTTMQLKFVEAITNENNIRSRNLLERNHFTRDAELELEKLGKEEPLSAVIYSRRDKKD